MTSPDRVPIAVAYQVLGLLEAGVFNWRAAPVSNRDWYGAQLTNAAIDAHYNDPPFASRLIAGEMRDAGLKAVDRQI